MAASASRHSCDDFGDRVAIGGADVFRRGGDGERRLWIGVLRFARHAEVALARIHDVEDDDVMARGAQTTERREHGAADRRADR